MNLEISINSLYICVKDMERAISFYERFFSESVFKKDKILSIFNIKNFNFCLFNNSEVNETVVWGDNCLPSIEVNDIDKIVEKLNILNTQIVFPLTKIGNNMVLEFKDSEGNDIEVYSKILGLNNTNNKKLC
ncbi:MAG: VOC family protein [Clostridiales bacterium]